jgi:hypothetical protein
VNSKAKYAARGDMTREQVKAMVRERDGHCCTKCGMTEAEHGARYGRRLEVHRTTPGSLYTMEGCVTLCQACHYGEPERAPGAKDAEYQKSCFLVRLPAVYREKFAELRSKTRRQYTVDAQLAIDAYLILHGIEPPPAE